MTNPEFSKDLAKEIGISQQGAREVVKGLETVIKEWILRGEPFKVADICFSVRNIEAHKHRNPFNGETVDVPASKKVIIKPSSTLKRLVNS